MVKIKGLHREVYSSRRERIKYWCIDRCLDPARVSFCLCNNDLKYLFPIKTLRHLLLSLQCRVVLFCFFGFYLFLPANSILRVVHTVHRTFIPSESADGRKSKSTGWARRPKTAFIIGDCGFISSQGESNWQNAPKVPASWSVNQLLWAVHALRTEALDISWKDVCKREQSTWLGVRGLITKKKSSGRCAYIKFSKEIPRCNHAATGSVHFSAGAWMT